MKYTCNVNLWNLRFLRGKTNLYFIIKLIPTSGLVFLFCFFFLFLLYINSSFLETEFLFYFRNCTEGSWRWLCHSCVYGCLSVTQIQVFSARTIWDTVRSRALEVARSNQWRQEGDCIVRRKTFTRGRSVKREGPCKDSARPLKGPGDVPLSILL